LGWILVALNKEKSTYQQSIDKILEKLKTNVTETAETANFITDYGDDGKLILLHSNRRTDAIILEAILDIGNPTHNLVPKIAKGLLANRNQGRWNNTQENCFILTALDKYFSIYEKETPDFVARIWLGEDFAGEHKFQGRTTEISELNIPMKYLVDGGVKDLVLQKEGVGRLYYRVGLRYAPENLQLKSANYGFLIERSYEGVEDASHVTRDANGVWYFKLGEKIRVKIRMTTTTRRYHVALVDKLPGGLEVLNPVLKGTPSIPSSNKSPFGIRYWDPFNWFEHQNLRDERVEAFQSLLWQGQYTYEYYTRATTSGEFIVPPTKAEEMYSPEIFGRSSTDFVIVS